jgi:exopolyphosphatase/guanosine-5'-triphosphate,3'-diphosphate pyrophosphatase
MLSTLVLGQKGNLRKIRETLVEADLAKAVLALRLAIVLMHARADDDIAGLRLRMRSRIDLDLPAELMRKHPTLAPWLEKEVQAWGEVGVPFQVRQV